MTERDRLAALQAENERLAALLDSHGIQWRQPPSPQPGVREPESTNLSTGRRIHGFDHPALDTMVLAMPISWRGTLQQYAGRLHREHAAKTSVRIIDFVDAGHPALLRMWDKRQRGYRAMGYRMAPELELLRSDPTTINDSRQ